jgi:hypothetical protein
MVILMVHQAQRLPTLRHPDASVASGGPACPLFRLRQNQLSHGRDTATTTRHVTASPKAPGVGFRAMRASGVIGARPCPAVECRASAVASRCCSRGLSYGERGPRSADARIRMTEWNELARDVDAYDATAICRASAGPIERTTRPMRRSIGPSNGARAMTSTCRPGVMPISAR